VAEAPVPENDLQPGTAMNHAATLPFAFAAALAATPCAAAPPAAATPLRADHPLIGAWQLTSRDGGCAETYRIDRGGTTLVTSAEEVAETRFTMSDQPSAKGYYKWVDTLVRDNGKKDCSGQVTKPGKSTTSYVLLSPAGNRFLLCGAEDGKQCIGPFVKLEGGEI
jgi:hypothetical protein